MGLPQELVDRLAPLTLAADRLLPVSEVLKPLFPWGGIQRGWSIGVTGVGAWSLAMALWADALGPDGWVAVVGLPDVGLAAAAEVGVRLDRLVLVETPPAGQWAAVVASLVDVFELVAVAPAGVSARDARRLAARVREREAVLFHLDGGASWPMALDLTLTGRVENGWDGLGRGHGHLRSRRLAIDAVGRRMGRARSVSVLLPGPRGRLAAVPATTSEPLPALV